MGMKTEQKTFFCAWGKRQESPKFIHPSGYCHGVPARDEDYPAGACSRSLIIIMGIGAHRIWVGIFFVGINWHSTEKGLPPKVSRLEMHSNRLLQYYKRARNNRSIIIYNITTIHTQLLLRFYIVSPIFVGFEHSLARHDSQPHVPLFRNRFQNQFQSSKW